MHYLSNLTLQSFCIHKLRWKNAQIKVDYWIRKSHCLIFLWVLYIGLLLLFWIAPHIAIALLTIETVIVVDISHC